jgi:hypothetical protein
MCKKGNTLLSDPEKVSGPLYDYPNPISLKSIAVSMVSLGMIVGIILLFLIPFQGCKKPETVEPDTVRVYKPNIYIYPQQPLNLKVLVSFPKGGKMVTSIPAYKNGWDVHVDATGKIDDQYEYLFYESDQPNEWQTRTGWIIEKEMLMSFFQKNMAEYMFSQKEIKDFTDYWIPKLTTFRYYLIYPQEKAIIENLIQVDYSTHPDNSLRLFYAIRGTDKVTSVGQHPVDRSFRRAGFFTTEWGVIIRQ